MKSDQTPTSTAPVASDAGRMSSPVPISHDGQTRAAVVTLLLEEGPITAVEVSERLAITAPGVRRHLDALIASGDVEAGPRVPHGGRGRPAKRFQLTTSGRGRLRHAYDDLAGAAMRKLREVGGEEAISAFSRDRIERIVSEVARPGTDPDAVRTATESIAQALTNAGFSATTRQVGNGVQICQHHCPVAHVASEFPELCEAETAVFTEILGTHVQRLATIANGDCVCTTHVPLPGVASSEAAPESDEQLTSSKSRKESS